MSTFLTLFRVTALFYIAFGFASITVAHADQVQTTSTCARLLSPTSFTQSKPSSEEVNWAEAYLTLLNLVLEGIDEIESHSFGYTNRELVKTQLLNDLIASKIPISPLVESQSQNLALDSTRPAIEGRTLHSGAPPPPRNLTNYSPKLSTLADSGQLEVVTENLTDEDWQYVRHKAQQMLAHMQAVRAAQTIARPETEKDFIDTPDRNGETRLFHLIRSGHYEEALQLVKSPSITAQYLNQANNIQFNNLRQTALDIAQAAHNLTPSEHTSALLVAMTEKNAALYSTIQDWEGKLETAIKSDAVGEVERLHQLGLKLMLSRTQIKSEHFNLAAKKSPQSLRYLLTHATPPQDVASVVESLYLHSLKSNSSPLVLEVLLDYLDLRNPFIDENRNSRTAFEHAVFFGDFVAMRRLAERGGAEPSKYSHLVRDSFDPTKGSVGISLTVLETLADLNIELDPAHSSGSSLMHLVVESHPNANLINTLCELGVDFEKKDVRGKTPWHYFLSKSRPQDVTHAFQACFHLRRRYAGIPLRKVFYTAYLDWVDRILRKIDVFPAEVLPSDRFFLKFSLLARSVKYKVLVPLNPRGQQFSEIVRSVTGYDFSYYVPFVGHTHTFLRLSGKSYEKFWQELQQRLEKLEKPADLDVPDKNGNLLLHRVILGVSLSRDLDGINSLELGIHHFNHRNNNGETVLDLLGKDYPELTAKLREKGALFAHEIVAQEAAALVEANRPAWLKFIDFLKKRTP